MRFPLLVALGLAPYLVARTGFCIHPAEVVGTIPKVGGTKDVNLANAQMQSISLNGGIVTSSQSPLVQDLSNSQSALSGFWMLVLFYPVMIIAFTYSFIIQVSKLIGGTYLASQHCAPWTYNSIHQKRH